MQFHKISDTKIHCVISQEEMWEKGIEIDDFLDHREKTEHFIREVLAEAKYELDLKDMGCFYSVQMSVMPEGDVSLVITGEHSNSTLEEFGKRLQNFKEVMEEAKKQMNNKKEQISEPEQETEAQDEETCVIQSRIQEVLDTPIWASVSSLDRCITISKQLAPQCELESAVYKYDDTYYMQLLFLEKESQVARTIMVVSEYAQSIFTEDQGGDLILEHGTPICAEHAVETLAAL